MAVLVLATLSPFVLRVPGPRHLAWMLWEAVHPGLTVDSVVDAIRNVVLFAGWGLLWVLSAGDAPSGEGRGAGGPAAGWARRPVARAIWTGLAISAALETIQLFVPTRTTSLLDVLTNTTGAALGAVAAVGMVAAASHRRGRKTVLGVPALPLTVAYGTALAFESAFPLLRSVSPGTYGGPATRLAWSLRHFAPGAASGLPLLDALLFLPLGYLAVATLVEAGMGRRAAAEWTAAGAAALAVTGEAAHLVLAQPVVPGAVLVHAAAPAFGALAAARWLPAPGAPGAGRRAARFLLGYVLVLALWAWRPFDLQLPPSFLSEHAAWRRLVPMGALGRRSDLDSVSEVMVDFFLYAPVGALLAVWPLRRRGVLAGLLPALWLALALEAGQAAVASRFVDITDALVAFAGAAVAWSVVRNAGLPVRGTLLGGGGGPPADGAGRRGGPTAGSSAPGP